MVRIARKYLETEYYHIMAQGIERNYIFQDNKMKEKYRKLIFDKTDYKIMKKEESWTKDGRSQVSSSFQKSPKRKNLSPACAGREVFGRKK